MHFKKIRRSLKGKNVHPMTRSWLLKCVKEENELAERLAAEIEKARAEGRCAALILSKPGRATQYRYTPPQEGKLCGKPGYQRGYCPEHFRTHVLHLAPLQKARAVKGITYRPFSAAEFPSGRLSEKQIDLMNDLGRLPMGTPLDECIERLNAEDRRSRLTRVKPQGTPKTRKAD